MDDRLNLDRYAYSIFCFRNYSRVAIHRLGHLRVRARPAVVNSKTIKVRFENDRVRVLEATLPPGVKEQVHSHPAYVIYVLEGGRYRNYASDGKTTEGELKSGEVLYRDPLTHAAENIGDKALHMILVELKK